MRGYLSNWDNHHVFTEAASRGRIDDNELRATFCFALGILGIEGLWLFSTLKGNKATGNKGNQRDYPKGVWVQQSRGCIRIFYLVSDLTFD